MTTDLSDITKSPLHDLIEDQTSPLDVVASWENLCDTYRTLEFSDPLSDTVRLEEFKWIIKEMNKFLTRMKKSLLTCKDIEAASQVLKESFTPVGKMMIDNRKALAFQKLKQRWITMILVTLDQMEEMEYEEESENAWGN